jgi:hypothetical protein
MLDYSSLFVFQFCWGGSDSPGAMLVYVPKGWVGESCVMCGAYLFVLPVDTQVGLEPVAAWRNGANFFQCSVA